jgi:hypothetical protein
VLEEKLAKTTEDLNALRVKHSAEIDQHNCDNRTERVRLHRLESFFHSQEEAISDVDNDDHTWGEPVLSPTKCQDAESTYKRLFERVKQFHNEIDGLKALCQSALPDGLGFNSNDSSDGEADNGSESSDDGEEKETDIEKEGEADLASATFANDAAAIDEAVQRETKRYHDKILILAEEAEAAEDKHKEAERAAKKIEEERVEIIKEMNQTAAKLNKSGLVEDTRAASVREEAQKRLEHMERRREVIETLLQESQEAVDVAHRKEREQDALHTAKVKELEAETEMNKAIQSAAAKELSRHENEIKLIKHQEQLAAETIRETTEESKALVAERNSLMAQLAAEEAKAKQKGSKKEDFRVVRGRKKVIREKMAQIEERMSLVRSQDAQAKETLKRLQKRVAVELDEHAEKVRKQLLGRKGAAIEGEAARESERHEKIMNEIKKEVDAADKKAAALETAESDLEARKVAFMLRIEKEATEQARKSGRPPSPEAAAALRRHEQEELQKLDKERIALKAVREGVAAIKLGLKVKADEEIKTHDETSRKQMQEAKALTQSVDEIMQKLKPKEQRLKEKKAEKKAQKKEKAKHAAQKAEKEVKQQQKGQQPRTIQEIVQQMKDAIAYRDHKIQELQHEIQALREGRVQALEMELSMNQQQVELLTGHTRKTIQVFASRLRMKGLYAYFLSWTAHVHELQSQRRLLTRFRATWNGNIEKRVLNMWVWYVKEEQRNQHVIKRVSARLQQSLVFKIFSAWAYDTKHELRFGMLMKHIGARLKHAKAVHFLTQWRQMKEDRVSARKMINHWYQRVVMASYFWGFNTLLEVTKKLWRETENMKAAEKLRVGMESKAQHLLVRFSNKKAGFVLFRWHEFARRSKREKVIMGRISKRWLETGLSSMLFTWIQYIKTRGNMRTVLLHAGHSLLRRKMKLALKYFEVNLKQKALQTLVEMKARLEDFEKLYEAQNEKIFELNAKAIERFKKMLTDNSMAKIFNAWLSFVAMKRDLSSLQHNLKHCFALIRDLSLDLVFDSWKKWTKESIVEGMPEIPMQLRKRIAGFMGMINISTVFLAWAKRTRTSLYQFVMAEGYIKRRARSWLASMFRAFVEEVLRAKREQYIILRMKARWSNMTAMTLLTKWHEFAHRQRFLRKFTLRYIDRYKRELISVWRRNARYLAELEGETIMENKIVTIYSRRQELKRLTVVYHAWCNEGVRARMQRLQDQNEGILRRVLGKFGGIFGVSLSSCMRSWISYRYTQATAKRNADVMFRKKMIVLRRDYFLAWKECVDEEKRFRYVVERYRAKADKYLLIRILVSWKEELAEDKRNREIIAKFSRRFKQQGIFKALNAWVSYWQEIGYQRNICKKAFNRLINQKVFSALRTWAGLIASDKASSAAEKDCLFEQMSKELAQLRAEHSALKELAHMQRVDAQTRNDNFLRKFMSRMFNKKAFDAFRLWVDVMNHDKFLIKMVYRMLNRQMSQAFQRWARVIDQHVNDLDFLRKFMLRMLNVRISSAFFMWGKICEASAKDARNKRFLRMMMMRMLNRRSSQAFRFWAKQFNLSREFRSQEGRNKAFLRKFIIRMLNVRTKSAFQHWSKSSAENSRDKIFLKKFIIRMLLVQYRIAFQQWVKVDHNSAFEKQFLKKFSIHMFVVQLRKGFSSWLTRSNVLKKNRIIVAKQIRALGRRRVRFAWRRWMEVDRVLVQRRMQERFQRKQQDFATHSLMRRMTMRSLDMAFQKWDQMVAAGTLSTMKENALRRMCGRMCTQTIRFAWKFWVSDAQSKHFLYQFMQRIMNHRLVTFLHHWAKNAQDVKEKGSGTHIMQRLFGKKGRQAVFRRFLDWASHARRQSQQSHTTRTVEVFFRRTVHRLLFKIFLAWASFCDMEQHEREVLRAVTNRMRQRSKYLAFSEWLRDHRQEKRDSHHVIMLKERWAKLMLQKVYRMWLEYLNHQNHVKMTFDKAQGLLANQERRRMYRAYKTWTTRISNVIAFNVAITKVASRWYLLCAHRLILVWKKHILKVKAQRKNEKYLSALVGKTSVTTVLRVLYAWRWVVLGAANSKKLVKRVVMSVAMGILRTHFRIWKRSNSTVGHEVTQSKAQRTISLMNICRHMQFWIKEHRRRAFAQWFYCTDLNPERRIIRRFRFIIARFLGNATVCKVYTSLRVWRGFLVYSAGRSRALKGICLRFALKKVRGAWEIWTLPFKRSTQNTRKATRLILLLESKAQSMSARAQKKHAMIQWMLKSSALHLASKSVKRLNRYYLLHSDRVAAAPDGPSLCKVVSEVIASILNLNGAARGSGGSLIILNEAEGTLWTMVSGKLAVRSVGTGLLGFVIGTGECVNVHNLTQDHRYKVEVDDVLVRSATLDTFFPKQRAFKMIDVSSSSPKSRFQRAMNKAQAGRSFQRGPENATFATDSTSGQATSVLLVPLIDLHGVTLGILSAVMDRERDSVNGFFGPDDVACMTFLGSQVYRVLHSLREAGAHGPSEDSQIQRSHRDQQGQPSTAGHQIHFTSPASKPEVNVREQSLVVGLAERVQEIESHATSALNAEVAIGDQLDSMSNFAHQVDETLHMFDNMHQQRTASGVRSPNSAHAADRRPFTNISSTNTNTHDSLQQFYQGRDRT